jgi:AcrR family transcriptional regulator
VAAALFAEEGFEAATMDAVAARSGTSPGSLYQFFPSKLVLFQALAERCLAQTQAVFDALMPKSGSDVPWTDLLDAMVDGLWMLQQSDVSYRAIAVNYQLYGHFAEADMELHRLIVSRVATELRRVAPQLTPAKRNLVAEMVVTTIALLLVASQRAPKKLATSMLEETKRLVRGYVAGYAASAAGR